MRKTLIPQLADIYFHVIKSCWSLIVTQKQNWGEQGLSFKTLLLARYPNNNESSSTWKFRWFVFRIIHNAKNKKLATDKTVACGHKNKLVIYEIPLHKNRNQTHWYKWLTMSSTLLLDLPPFCQNITLVTIDRGRFLSLYFVFICGIYFTLVAFIYTRFFMFNQSLSFHHWVSRKSR